MRPERIRLSTLVADEVMITLSGRLRDLKGRLSSANRSRLDSTDRSAYDFQEIVIMSTFVLFRSSSRNCCDRVESSRIVEAEIW